MPHELTTPPTTPHEANGHAAPPETPLARALRILGGDVRPDDYLPVPDELTRRIDGELRLAQSLRPHAVLGDAERAKVIQDRILTHHHDGVVAAVLRTDDGVIVLGVGLDEIGPLVRGVPHEIWKGVVIECPFSGIDFL